MRVSAAIRLHLPRAEAGEIAARHAEAGASLWRGLKTAAIATATIAIAFAVLGAFLLLTVASVVRLALFARRDERHIMQLVGAPVVYIRGPFIAEGLIQGAAGALIALGILWITFFAVRSRADSWLAGAIDPASLVFLSIPTSFGLLLAGALVGALGGFIAARSTREIAD